MGGRSYSAARLGACDMALATPKSTGGSKAIESANRGYRFHRIPRLNSLMLLVLHSRTSLYSTADYQLRL